MDLDEFAQQIDDITARALLEALAARITGGARSGIRSWGRDADIEIQLSNGQEFRISIEEL